MKPIDEAYQAAADAISLDTVFDLSKKECFDIAKVAVDAAYAAQFPPSEDYAGLVERLNMLDGNETQWSAVWEIAEEAADAIERLLVDVNALQEGFEMDFDRLRAERDEAVSELKAQTEYNEVLTCKKLSDIARSAERYWEARWRDELDDNYKLLTQLHEWMCRQEETASTLKRIEVERDALAARLQTAADRLEKLAGDMRPPNNITPQLFMLANSMKQNVQQSGAGNE